MILLSLDICFVTPSGNNNLLQATNFHSFLCDAGCSSSIIPFPTCNEGFFKLPCPRTVYVLFLESKEDVSAWLKSQNHSKPIQLPITQVVLVVSSKFLSDNPELGSEIYKWLFLEQDEFGKLKDPNSSFSRVLFSVVSVKLADLALALLTNPQQAPLRRAW